MHLKFPVLILLICIISPGISAQDILYKSNGEKLTAKVLLKNRYELTYKITGSQDSILHHISTAALDSALYQDGTKENFASNRVAKSPLKSENPVYGRHLIGFDVGAILFFPNNLSFSYEYLMLKQRLGIKAQFGSGIKDNWYYDLIPDAPGTAKGRFTRFGMNWYFFPPGGFRIGTGLHFIASNYSYSAEKWIYDQEPPYESHLEYLKGKSKYRFVVISTFAFYQIFKNLAVNVGIDFPRRGPNNGSAIFRSEILLNF